MTGRTIHSAEKNYVPDEIEFRTKPQIALELIDRAMANGIQVRAWTFDELYGRDGAFLDGLEARQQMFVGEIPCHFRGWLRKPCVLRRPPRNTRKRGRGKKYPRLPRRPGPCEVRNLATYSPTFREQSWQRYRIKDTDKGPEIWEVKWSLFWRKSTDHLPSRRHCLIVARNVRTGEVKYFLANRVPGEAGTSLRRLLRIAFGRCSVESCFRQAKEELGLDHYEVRGWRCVHRHYYLTQLSQLFCARMRQKYDDSPEDQNHRLTVEQVRSAINVWLSAVDLKPEARTERCQQDLKKQRYHQRRNAQARKSHTKRRVADLRDLGIDADRIKSCLD